MLLTNTLVIDIFETPRLGCHTGAKTASLDENCCSFERPWTTAAAVSNAPSITKLALRKGRLSGSSSLGQLLMAGRWKADEDCKLREAVPIPMGQLKLLAYGIYTPEDIKSIGLDVLRHRVVPTYEAEAEDLSSEDLVKRLFELVEVP